MKTFKKSLAALALAAVTLFSNVIAPAVAVHADDSGSGEEKKPAIWIQVSPVSNRVLLNAGAELTYLFNVDNIGTDSFNFKVYTVPYHVTDESYNVNFSDQTPRTQLSRWISFKKEDSDEFATEAQYYLRAGERKTIEYRIKIPDDIPSGGQYAAIVTEYVPNEESASGTGVQTIPRVNSIVYGTTRGDTLDLAEINEHTLSGFLTEGNITSVARITNKGNTDFTLKSEFKVESIFGQTEYETTTSYDVLPDTTRRIENTWEKTPGFGIFHVTSKLSVLDEVSEQSKLVLKIPIFVIIIIVLLLTVLVVWIIILIRKRQTRKSRVIV